MINRIRPARLAILSTAVLVACQSGPVSQLAVEGSRGAVAEVERLLNNSDIKPGDKNEALIFASGNGHPRAIQLLLAAGADPDVFWGGNGWTPLMHAIHKNQLRSVGELLRGGAEVNLRTPAGRSALSMASGYGQASIVKMLLDYGADPLLGSESGESALAAAVRGVRDIDSWTHGDCQTETVTILLAATPEQRLRKDEGLESLLRTARRNECEDIVQMLVFSFGATNGNE